MYSCPNSIWTRPRKWINIWTRFSPIQPDHKCQKGPMNPSEISVRIRGFPLFHSLFMECCYLVVDPTWVLGSIGDYLRETPKLELAAGFPPHPHNPVHAAMGYFTCSRLCSCVSVTLVNPDILYCLQIKELMSHIAFPLLCLRCALRSGHHTLSQVKPSSCVVPGPSPEVPHPGLRSALYGFSTTYIYQSFSLQVF